ncbi:hypothetical protein O181_087266 [Austropuccinia psidii MF-1]|uniref:Uncharacterized protein n=1 Tax=Austropuccinia psidii MF-1 TaxID=1389203 RepID=A0A9Q3P584_9BASI|nr:hypothetical protein [Austropuccinia psidii MF-1]
MRNDKIHKDLLEDFKEAQYGTHLTSNMKLNSVKVLGKCRKAFVIGDELLGKIKGHDIELYLDLERAYPPMVKQPTYPDIQGTRKEAEKHLDECLEMVIRTKIGENDILEVTTPILIAWNDGKSRLCGDFIAQKNFTKAYRYPIPRISHELENSSKAKFINNMDFMKGFHQN